MMNKKWFTLLMTLTLPLIMAACTALNNDRDLFQDKVSMGTSSPGKEVSSPGIAMKELLPDPSLVQGQLENGLRYVLLANSTPENRISMHLDVQVGSMNEADGQQGSAHYLEHMLFNGLTHYKPGELVEYFQSIGMMFGPDANAHTGFL